MRFTVAVLLGAVSGAATFVVCALVDKFLRDPWYR